MNLFIALSEFQVPFAELADTRPAHLEFLDSLGDVLVAAGPQDPPVGGCLVLRAAHRAEADALLAREPFAAAGLVSYAVTEVKVTRGRLA